MRARFLGKDPGSTEGDSPTLFATDRTDVGPVPEHETLIDIPEDVLRFYARRQQKQERDN
jgi:hypothetical protein